jgi:hypothetical protein
MFVNSVQLLLIPLNSPSDAVSDRYQWLVSDLCACLFEICFRPPDVAWASIDMNDIGVTVGYLLDEFGKRSDRNRGTSAGIERFSEAVGGCGIGVGFDDVIDGHEIACLLARHRGL